MPWVEEQCLSVEKGLRDIEGICVNIPTSYFGAIYLSELLAENHIQHEIVEVENIEVLADGKIASHYYIGKKKIKYGFPQEIIRILRLCQLRIFQRSF